VPGKITTAEFQPEADAREWLAQNAPADLRAPLREPPRVIGPVEREDLDVHAARAEEWRRTWRQGQPAPSAETRQPPPKPTRGAPRAFSERELEKMYGRGYDAHNPDPDAHLQEPDLEDDDDLDASDFFRDEAPLPCTPSIGARARRPSFRFEDDDDLDDRPQWARDLGLDEEWFEQEAERDRGVAKLTITEAEPAVVPCADGCGNQAKPRGTLCAACYEYRRTHGGKPRPPRLTVGRRTR